MRLRILLMILAAVTWPAVLIIGSRSLPWVYLLPGIITFLSLLLSDPLPLLLIPVISPKLALFPFIFFLFFFLFFRTRANLVNLLISLILLITLFPFGQTIFRPDYEKNQQIIRNTRLYPNVLLARTYQNKAYIYLDRLTANLTHYLDPGAYFFANHPRELSGGPNLVFFPYPLLVFFLPGLLSLSNYKSQIVILFAASLLSLSVLTVPYGHDFILWPWVLYLIFRGLNAFESSSFRYKLPVYTLISFLSLYNFMQSLISL